MPARLAIAIDKLRFAYQDEVVLSIDQLHIPTGQKTFLAGPSGSGKSTLLALLAGIVAADSGRLLIHETPLQDLTRSQCDRYRADQIGYIFQSFNLISYLSVQDNVLLPCRFSKRRRQAALKRSDSLPAEATRLLKRLGITGDQISRHVDTLSTGQAQRVAVARALIGSPPLIIADEPTSALDQGNRDQFVELLISECEQSSATLLFVSHDETLARHFDRTIRMPDLNQVEMKA